jgi:glyoxylase-like metal-dependent hydrolase (beta-lactamase superfamily II)
MGVPDARVAFKAGLARAGLDLAGLKTIVLTHHHPDHVGLSGELQEQTGARVLMHPLDVPNLAYIREGTMEERFNVVSRFFRQHGLDATELWYAQVDPQVLQMVLRVPPEEALTLIEDGEILDLAGELYRVVWVPGHADGMVALWRERDGVFLAADHVLSRITPNVGLYSEHDRPNPLADYLDSLHKVAQLPASVVLPGHGEPFPDLAGRVQEIVQHHAEREDEILHLLQEQPQSATDLTRQLFPSRRIESHEALRMAVAEILAHLEHMRYDSKVAQQRENDLILYHKL